MSLEALEKFFDTVRAKRKGSSIRNETENYIKEVTDFLQRNSDLPRNQYSEGFGEVNKSNPRMWTKRYINVGNDDGELRPFTYAFAQFCLQVARNLSPYQTGNLRDNIDVSWSSNKIEIMFNSKGTATYMMYLDNGYPNAKWQGFINNIRQTIAMLCMWWQSGNKEDFAKLNLAVKSLGSGGKSMRSLRQIQQGKSTASIVKFRRSNITGWERTSLPKGQKTITPTDRALIGSRTNVRKERTKTEQTRVLDRQKLTIKALDLRYKRQVKERNPSTKTRGK